MSILFCACSCQDSTNAKDSADQTDRKSAHKKNKVQCRLFSCALGLFGVGEKFHFHGAT